MEELAENVDEVFGDGRVAYHLAAEGVALSVDVQNVKAAQLVEADESPLLRIRTAGYHCRSLDAVDGQDGEAALLPSPAFDDGSGNLLAGSPFFDLDRLSRTAAAAAGYGAGSDQQYQ